MVKDGYTLEVTKRPLTLKANDANNVYTGSEITYATASDAKDPYYTISSDTTLADGQSITAATLSGSRTDVGTTQITIAKESVQIGTYTANYEITVQPGTLTITKAGGNDVTPEPDPTDPGETMDAGSKNITVVYDGKSHTVSAEATKAGSTIYYKYDGGEWTTDAPSRTDVGKTAFSIKATNPNYEEVVKNGWTLTVTPAKITANDTATRTYTGADQTLTIGPDKATGVVDGEVLTLAATITGRAAGTYTDVAEGFVWSVMKADGVTDSTGNYTIDVTGTLTINSPSSGGGGGPTPPPVIIPDDDVPLAPIPDALNGEDHFAYVKGYPDQTVRPEGNITRAETATMIYRLLKPVWRDIVFTDENSFSDVAQMDWFNKAVSSMANGEYITGYPDGTFQGNKSITRAEFVTIMIRFLGEDPIEENPFTDIGNHWAKDYILTAVGAGWIDGYPDGTFQPNALITRAEAMKIINSVLHRGVNETSELGNFINFPDNEVGKWYYYEVLEAVNDHEHEGERPNENWTSNSVDYFYDIVKYEHPGA